MRLRNLIPLLLVALTACDELLDVQPVDETSDTEAITDGASAQAALVGAYAALAGGSYYAGDIMIMNEQTPAKMGRWIKKFNIFLNLARYCSRSARPLIAIGILSNRFAVPPTTISSSAVSPSITGNLLLSGSPSFTGI